MIRLELFSCAGGMAEGFRRAGIVFDMAVDMAPDHVASYEANLGHKPVTMDARDLLRMAKLGWRVEVDLLVADPPCTPWSRAGKRKGTTDERDMLVDTCEIIKLLRPKRYLIGNVPGLDDQPNWHIVQQVIGGLEQHGYCVADFAALDAADYGVPQNRVRPFWFGHRDGPCIRWPAPSHADPDLLRTLTLPGIEPLLPWVTCRQALGHLPPAELGRPVRLRKRGCNGSQHGSVAEKPARVVGTSNLSDGNVNVLLGRAASDEAGRKKAGPSGKPSGSRTAAPYAGGYTPSELDKPAKTLVRNTHGDGSTCRGSSCRRPRSSRSGSSSACWSPRRGSAWVNHPPDAGFAAFASTRVRRRGAR